VNEQLRVHLARDMFCRATDIKVCEQLVEEIYELGRKHEASLS